jgi:hypothetical protein
MVSRYQVSDRNVVSLLLLLHSRGEICTVVMAEVSQLNGMKKAALRLQKAGLVSSMHCDTKTPKVLWKLTPAGKIVADSLNDAEKRLSDALLVGNYFKE